MRPTFYKYSCARGKVGEKSGRNKKIHSVAYIIKYVAREQESG